MAEEDYSAAGGKNPQPSAPEKPAALTARDAVP